MQTTATQLPTVKGDFLLGNVREFSASPHLFVEKMAREHGDFVLCPLAGIKHYSICSPSAIEEILLTRHKSFIKDPLTAFLGQFLGQGLLTNEGDSWKRQRKLAAPAFGRSRVDAYGDAMVAHTTRYLSTLKPGELRHPQRDFMDLALRIAAEVLFGVSLDDDLAEIADELEVMLDYFNDYAQGIKQVLPSWLPTPMRRKFRARLQRFDNRLARLIAARRGNLSADLLSQLISSVDDSGAMNERQLRDESITILLAGHETTGLTLTYTTHLLSRNPGAEQALIAELASVLKGAPPKASDMGRLPYLTAVVKESMRLFPPAWAVGREALEECEIGGHRLPKGAMITLPQWVVHRDPRWFADPLAFKPERWLSDLEKTIPRFAYFPFGGGPRVCIGNHFAMMEVVLILATVYQSVRFAKVSDAPLELYSTVTLRPKTPEQMRVLLAAVATA